jgi:hypothetical protein
MCPATLHLHNDDDEIRDSMLCKPGRPVASTLVYTKRQTHHGIPPAGIHCVPFAVKIHDEGRARASVVLVREDIHDLQRKTGRPDL